MTTIRTDLQTAKQRAALAPYTNEALMREVSEIPLASAAKSYLLPMHCDRTGILIGSLSLITAAGHMPMIGQWRETLKLHPIFSLDHAALLSFAKNTWFRFCNFSEAESTDDKITKKQEETLQIAALAMIYKLSEVRQDIPWLPSWQEVSAHWSSLISLSYWKLYLESERFRFPSLHVSKWEKPELAGYISACFATKKDYETKVSEVIEREKIKTADRALVAIRNDLGGHAPRSPRMLWRWFVANMPKRYHRDLDGWMQDIFFSKPKDIFDYTLADIDLFEQIFLAECPTGNVLSHTFLKILSDKRKLLEDYVTDFQIILPAAVQAETASKPETPEPKITDFPSRAHFLVAHAKWKVSKMDLSTGFNLEMNKQAKLTVSPTYIPELDLGSDPEDDLDPASVENLGVDLPTKTEFNFDDEAPL